MLNLPVSIVLLWIWHGAQAGQAGAHGRVNEALDSGRLQVGCVAVAFDSRLALQAR